MVIIGINTVVQSWTENK